MNSFEMHSKIINTHNNVSVKLMLESNPALRSIPSTRVLVTTETVYWHDWPVGFIIILTSLPTLWSLVLFVMYLGSRKIKTPRFTGD